jgi:hypothetical protein
MRQADPALVPKIKCATDGDAVGIAHTVGQVGHSSTATPQMYRSPLFKNIRRRRETGWFTLTGILPDPSATQHPKEKAPDSAGGAAAD